MKAAQDAAERQRVQPLAQRDPNIAHEPSHTYETRHSEALRRSAEAARDAVEIDDDDNENWVRYKLKSVLNALIHCK